MENFTHMGKDYENFYIHGGCVNGDWSAEPVNEWGTVGGLSNQSCDELPSTLVQRKNVRDYASQHRNVKGGIYSIHFSPKSSKEEAERTIAEAEMEILRMV